MRPPEAADGEVELAGRSRRLLGAIGVALVVAAAGGLAAAYVAGGPAGMVTAGTAVAVLALLATRAALPAGEGAHRFVRRNRPRRKDDDAESFPAYRKIYADLGWAATSRRHYDHGVRPLLVRLLAARLAERYGLDARARPGQARALIGSDLWPLVDPSAPPSYDSGASGVSLATLARLVTRLEEL
ncbi:MAG TPA: hypothetical protein VGS62_06460 [Streptosporangiaceae bacterium]|nr:hypothetical protein [Streptosporangiaceae bacterium]